METIENQSAPRRRTSEASTRKTSRTIPVDGKSIPDTYLRRLELSLDERVFLVKRNGAYTDVTWREVHSQILGIFLSLKRSGIGKGDRVCIAAQSRPEWFIADLAIMACGAVTVPIYHSSSLDDVAYILEHCQAKVVFAEDAAQCEKIAQAFQEKAISLPVVLMSGKPTQEDGLTWTTFTQFAEVADGGEPFETLKKSIAAIRPDDMCSIVYTSGTTGRPKGAVLTHSNFSAELRSIVHEIVLHKDDLTLTFLPFAHILGRVESLLPIFAGVTLAFAESINAVAANIQEVKPTLLVSVPRIYEKIYAKIQSEVESSPGLKKNLFQWAVAIGRQVARLRATNDFIPPWLGLRFAIADRLVFEKVRAKLGGRVRLSVSGGAPLSRDLCEFLHACGIKVLEGYGLTETTAAAFVNRPDDYAFGTVGKPIGDTELRIAEDGEILLRGSLIFREYFNNPEATEEVLTGDGWFATGDIGEVDSRGNLRITDRKKELIVTSGGKKVAPQKLENLIKGSRFFSNGMVYGDKQKYLVALLTLNEPEITKWAKEQGVAFTCLESLTKQAEVEEIVEKEIRTINKELASFESIKKFKILPHDFTIERGEITPSMKLKRKVVTQHYREIIDSMYV